MSHEKKDFNGEMQVEYTYIDTLDGKHFFLHILDEGTPNAGTESVPDLWMTTAENITQANWINRQGAPK